MEKPIIIVTGGAGFIGSHTVVELINAGYEPVIMDDFSNSKRWILDRLETITNQKITCLEVDCKDYDAMHAQLSNIGKIQGLIHFAAYKSVSESVAQPLKYYENNVMSLINVLKLIKSFEIPHFVFSSSCTVYGQSDVLPVIETAEIKKAASPYGYTKQVGEQLIGDELSSGAVILRYFNPIGAHPSGLIGELPNGTPENLVPYITQTAAGIREKLMVYGSDYNTPDGTCIRDYIHVVDLAKAHVKSLEYLKDKDVIAVFNVGTGKGNSVLEMITTFEEVNDLKLNYEITGRRPGDIEQIYSDTTKVNQELGWKAIYGIQESLRDAWNWQKGLENEG